MIAVEPVLGISIFILLEIQHQIITAPLGWNTFPHSIKREAILLSGTPEAVDAEVAKQRDGEGRRTRKTVPPICVKIYRTIFISLTGVKCTVLWRYVHSRYVNIALICTQNFFHHRQWKLCIR